jgi:nucleotide-binding universal stress UspA family protein
MKTLETSALISLKNILLATDLSASSQKALQYARALAHEHGASVHTLYVSGPDNYQLLCPYAFATTFEQVPANCDGLAVLQGLLSGLPHEVPLHGRKVWEVIADVSERNEIDLLILGTHGRKGLDKLLFGSVAEEVFRNVSCPVLTVGADAEPPTLDNTGRLVMEKILLATDFNPLSQAPSYACAVSERFQAELHELHVAASVVEGMPGRQVKDHIAGMAPEVGDLTRKASFLVEYGEPGTKIPLVAEELKASLIVLGARHPRNAKAHSHVPWATVARVIAGGRCPVLTVRDADNKSGPA